MAAMTSSENALLLNNIRFSLVYEIVLSFFQALSTYSSIPQIAAQLHFLKAQVLLASGEPVEIGLNLLQTSLLSSPVQSPNAWQVIPQILFAWGKLIIWTLLFKSNLC